MQWVGALIARLDAALNRDTLPELRRRLNGVAALLALLAAVIAPIAALTTVLEYALPQAAAIIVMAFLAASLIAQRSLYDHVTAVADALERDGLTGGRRAVAMIVGRNPETLDEAGVARAAIESLAENFSDGVVAPAFWTALFGLPGVAAYKTANTADSMIGHLTPRHRAFGWAAARFDDAINLLASRLAALWLVIAASLSRDTQGGRALSAMLRDAGKHRSPNAGWPEAAMAGALGLRLAGPRIYGATRVDDHWMGDGSPDASAVDIRRALLLYRRACGVQGLCVALLLAVSALS